MISVEEQIDAEARLAQRLLTADDAQRPAMYGEVYDEIYSMHLQRAPDVLEFGASEALLPFLLGVTRPGDHVLEVGCGTGMLSIALARENRVVTGTDVSAVALELARSRSAEVPGVSFEQVSGFDLGEDERYDFAFSVEVLEHLHERDVAAHLAGVRRVLKPGGSYWIWTPHPSGSDGVGQRFGVDDVEASADVHLKEWTYTELQRVLEQVGFEEARIPFPVGRPGRRRTRRARLAPMLLLERAAPAVQRHRVTRSLLWRLGLNPASCSVLARKPRPAG